MTEDRALELALAALHQGRRLARTEANVAEYAAAINALEAIRSRERSAPEKIWLAHAPAGRWTSGPSVCHWEDHAQGYSDMGWRVEGPFVLAGSNT